MKYWKRKPDPKPEENPYFKDGKLTEKGKEFAARYLVEDAILGSGPQPINFAAGGLVQPAPPSNSYTCKDMINFAVQGCTYGSLLSDRMAKLKRDQQEHAAEKAKRQRLLDHLLAQGLSFNPAPVTPRTSPVSKIPVSGMSGFSESGQPAEWDLAIGEITGYRWWKVRVPARFAGYQSADGVPFDPDNELKVIGQNNYTWMPGVLEARCSNSGSRYSWADPTHLAHEPPEIRVACGCGFWGYFDPHLDVYSHFPNLKGKYPHRPYGNWVELPVLGVIKASGRVIVGEKGFRSQYAEIAGLCIPEATRSQLSWWTNSVSDLAEYSNYLRGSVMNTTTFRAMMGGPGWYTNGNHGNDHSVVEAEPATKNEVLARLATLETWLGNAYPGCRVFTDEESMTGYFPPDNNYRG